MTSAPGDDSIGVSEALSEALRAAEADYWLGIEEMIRAYQSAPEKWVPGGEKNPTKRLDRG